MATRRQNQSLREIAGTPTFSIIDGLSCRTYSSADLRMVKGRFKRIFGLK